MLWVVAEGIIYYSMFDKEKHVVKASDYKYKEYYISCDYGTQNATVFGLWGKTFDDKHVMIKEYYYSGRDTGVQKTDLDFSNDLKEFTKDYKIKYVVLDPSAAYFKAQLIRDKFKVLPVKNSVLDGIRLVASLLGQYKILFDESCNEIFKEFSSYVWDYEACKKGEDKVVKDHDHSMDQVRYFGTTVIKNKGKDKKTLKR